MGKKDKNKKKGKGAEKTSMKTEKKASLKQKKLLAKIGEADILEMVEKLERDSQTPAETQEIKCEPPSPRSNFSIVAHPDKDELILFGGEYFDGQKTTLYNDLYFYSVPKNEWRLVKCGGSCPTPRSGHQMVTSSADGGQLWLFGGEYASPSQMQFIHFKDLWVFRFNTRRWEKINAPDGPSARSGHRMVIQKKKLYVFGGFHDNNSAYRYFNDVHCFSLESYSWLKLKVAGVNPPAPRSGCCLIACPDGKILMWGGYSKSSVKKELDRGTTHWDSFHLVPDKNDATGLSWKWVSVKLSGARPPPRSGMSSVLAANGKVYVFGGVMDVEEDEESIKGQFNNDLYTLDIGNLTWRQVDLAAKKKRGVASGKDAEMRDEEADKPNVQTSTDGVFTMTVGGSSKGGKCSAKDGKPAQFNGPTARSHAGLAFSKGQLYVYAGLVEEGDREYTLKDFYSLDVHKLEEWKTILGCDLNALEWLGSDSEDSDDDDETEGDMDDDSDSDDDDSEDEDDSDGMDTE